MKTPLIHFFFLWLALSLSACGSGSADQTVDGSHDQEETPKQDTPDSQEDEKQPVIGSDLLPQIVVSRTQGELPFHIYVSASYTEMVGASHPFDEVSYSWDFGDSDGLEVFTHPVTGQQVNANTDQLGPEASYVYRYADEYQVTLTASFQQDDQLIEESTTITVNAQAWSGETRFIDPELGDDNNDGTTENASWKTWTSITDWISSGDHRQALIKRGTTLPVSHNITFSTSHIRLGAYGEGESPLLIAQNDIDNFMRLSPADNMVDHVYSGLVLNGNNGNASSLIYSALIDESAALTLDHIAFIDMTFINDDSHEVEIVIVDDVEVEKEIINASNFIAIQNRYNGTIHDVLIWHSDFQRNHSFKNGIYAEMKTYFSVVASTFSGGDGSSLKDHPIYPAGIEHALYRWIDFKETYSNNFSINGTTKDGKTLRYTLVDGCSVTGGSNGVDFSRHNSDAVGWFGDLIIQNNAFFNLGNPNQGIAVYGGSLERATIRNNIFYGNPQSDIFVKKEDLDPNDWDVELQEVDLQITGNKFWKGGDNQNTLAILDLQDIQTLDMSNNVLVNEGVRGGSTLLAQFLFPVNKQWVIDNNQYWAPQISTPFKELNLPRDYYDFSEWQQLGYDQNGSHSDPLFTNPSMGEF